jgi:hypothetical protein
MANTIKENLLAPQSDQDHRAGIDLLVYTPAE